MGGVPDQRHALTRGADAGQVGTRAPEDTAMLNARGSGWQPSCSNASVVLQAFSICLSSFDYKLACE